MANRNYLTGRVTRHASHKIDLRTFFFREKNQLDIPNTFKDIENVC